MKTIVTFGEVMMRLCPPRYAKFSQTDSLEMEFGGGEANVAISLAYLGMMAKHVSCFPNDYVGKAAVQFLRKHWVNTSETVYNGDTLGLYFMETGAVHRSSRIVYNRTKSSFSELKPELFDWYKILDGADWFHWTGITPAISETAAKACLDAMKVANELGVTVSSDLNFREGMWKYTENPTEVMMELIQHTDVVIAGKRDIGQLTGQDFESDESGSFLEACKYLKSLVPRIQKIANKNRESVNASHNIIKSKIWNGQEYLKTQKLDVTHIIDRVGTGDAFAAGLIYGLLHFDDEKAINFANAACALKHTVEGDANLVGLDDVERVMQGNLTGSIIR